MDTLKEVANILEGITDQLVRISKILETYEKEMENAEARRQTSSSHPIQR